MKQFSKTQLAILDLLSDGHCHSGSAIGQQLGVSRTTVWKYISQFDELGLAIRRFPQQGYQLAKPIKPLNEQLIRQQLENRQFANELNFHLFADIGSTNKFLKEISNSAVITICCAEKQSQGRGRFGRQWLSPFGENIYFSGRWELNCCLSHLAGLSLVVGLAILASLADNNIHQGIRLKWPNDVMWKQKKLCGILIEIMAETNSCAQVIIGIGINVNMATEDKPWCSLSEIRNGYYDRNIIIANLILHLTHYLDKFLLSGFAAFIDEWQALDYLQDQQITVSQPTGSISGQACGVNEQGQLCLRDNQGNRHYLSSGDTSLSTDFRF